MMYTYSIVPLTEQNFDDICNDVIDQYKRGISTCPLFKMTLVPEGNPVWDKVSKQAELYERYREALEPHGVKSGVLVQASLGHGYNIEPNPFQQMINFTDGESNKCCCPEDEAFIEHFSNVLKRIALAHPSAIMLDDDFRMVERPGRGCTCPLHMAEFNRRAGTSMTRQELHDYIVTHPDNDPLTEIFLATQRDSLVKAATAFRQAIDSVDPTIQGINCTSGDECDSAIFTNPIFAGKGNPTMVRVPNGTYSPESPKGISDTMRRAVVCSSKLKNHGIDIILAETDTVPFNRYAKNARYMHTHYTASILDGLKGAKHWITRLGAHEPLSGKAYRDILAEHSEFYEKLSQLADDIKWVGANSFFIEQVHHMYSHSNIWQYHSNTWATKVLERMGIPFYFADHNSCAAFIEGDIVRDMTDEQIKQLFEGSVIASADAANDLVERGYGDLLGVSLSMWDKGPLGAESFDAAGNLTCQRQKDRMLIVPESPRIEVLSHNIRVIDGKPTNLAPAVTLYPRDNGRISVVYCGTPDAEHNYYEGFAFLNESRKNQFISILKRAGALPVYYHGDNEICLRSGYLSDGTLLCAAFDLSYDPMDELDLYLEKAPSSIKLLCSDGSLKELEWKEQQDNIYSVQTKVEPLYPVVILIK